MLLTATTLCAKRPSLIRDPVVGFGGLLRVLKARKLKSPVHPPTHPPTHTDDGAVDGSEKQLEQEMDQEQVKPGGYAHTAAKEEDEPAPVDGQEAAVEDLDLCFAVDCTGSMASYIA